MSVCKNMPTNLSPEFFQGSSGSCRESWEVGIRQILAWCLKQHFLFEKITPVNKIITFYGLHVNTLPFQQSTAHATETIPRAFSPCRSVFSAMPELTVLLPPEAPPQARPFCLGGLKGQQARATVYIEEILLPKVQDGLHSRPKPAVYHTTYRLVPASG